MATFTASVDFPDSPVTQTEVMHADSFSDQVPSGSGLANAMQVEFGATQTSSDGCWRLTSDGTIEKLTECYQLEITIDVRVGRTVTAQTSIIVAWMEVALDGVTFSQPLDSGSVIIESDASNRVQREAFNIQLDAALPVGAKVRFMFARDESGFNDGGLYTASPTGTLSGLNAAPSASLSLIHHHAY